MPSRWKSRRLQHPLPHKDDKLDNYPRTKIVLGELRSLLKILQQQRERKSVKISTQKGRNNSCILSASSHTPGQHSSRRNVLAWKSSPHWERENWVSNQLPKPLGTLHEGSILFSLHPETDKAKTSRDSQEQEEQRIAVSAMKWEQLWFLVVCYTKNPSSFCHWRNQ